MMQQLYKLTYVKKGGGGEKPTDREGRSGENDKRRTL